MKLYIAGGVGEHGRNCFLVNGESINFLVDCGKMADTPLDPYPRLTPEQIKQSGFDAYFVDHTNGIYPQAASGTPFSAATLQSTGDAIADLFEDMAAEQKARLTYDNLLRLIDDPDVRDPIKFLREREIVHFQRFGETLRDVQENLDAKNYYAYNPSFDAGCVKRLKKR